MDRRQMLEELYDWIIGSEPMLVVAYQVVTADALARERIISERKLNHLIADRHNATEDAMSYAVKQVMRYRGYKEFVIFCIRNLGENPSVGSFLLALKYLLVLDHDPKISLIHHAHVNSVFFALMRENKEAAVLFYDSCQDKFEPFDWIKLSCSKEKTLDHLEQLKCQLRLQESPSIAHLFSCFMEDVEQFAASILWLIHKKVSIQYIFQTNLLHDFFLHHVAWLDSINSPIRHVYALLSQFEQAEELVNKARTVQCKGRGFYSTKKSDMSYSITGDLFVESSSSRVKSVTLQYTTFTPTQANFESLHEVFGVNFLYEALLWNLHEYTPCWGAALGHTINSDTHMKDLLPALINLLGARGKFAELEHLASLMLDITFEKLLGHRSRSIFHILPYKPILLRNMTLEDVTLYLSFMTSDDENSLDALRQLVALFNAFKTISHRNIACMIYEAILDILVHHPELNDDRDLTEKLQRFPGKEALIISRYKRLKLDFDHIIASQLVDGAVNTVGYHMIEDAWLLIFRERILLEKMVPLFTDCPHDKYQLQAHWMKLYFMSHQDRFHMSAFIAAFEVSPELLPDVVSEYERVLIETLTTIDDKIIRNDIIAEFEKNDVQKYRWRTYEYGDACVFDRALKQGNIGLLEHLSRYNIAINSESVSIALFTAKDSLQWGVVRYLCAAYAEKLSQKTLKIILESAIEQGQLPTVQLLCTQYIHHLIEQHIVKSLVEAATNGHRDVIEYFCRQNSGFMFNGAVRVKVLQAAVDNNQLDVIEYFGQLPEQLPLVLIMERAFEQAATNNHLLMVQRLSCLQTNMPRQQVIEDTLVKVVKLGHLFIVDHLIALLNHAMGQETTDKAFFNAMIANHLLIVQRLCALDRNKPSPLAVDGVLQRLVKDNRLALVTYLCELKQVVVSQQSLDSAMISSIRYKHIPMVHYLSPRVAHQTLEKAMTLAVKLGDISIIKCCCELLTPDRRAIWKLLKQKSHANEVDEYFRSLLPSIPRSKSLPIFATVDDQSANAHGFRKNMSCSALPKLGLFKSPCDLLSQEPIPRPVKDSLNHLHSPLAP